MNGQLNFTDSGELYDLMLMLSIGFAGLIALTHLLMAVGVAVSVTRRREYGRSVAFLGAPGWFPVVLVFGLLGWWPTG